MKYLIFGASGTLGQSLISLLRNQGQEVCGILHKSNYPNLLHAKYIYNCDVSNFDSINRALDEIKLTFGIPDHIVSCVGVSAYHDFINDNIEDWYNTYNINFCGSVNIVHGVSKMLVDSGKKGSITLVGSGYSERHIPFLSSYCVSKSSIVALVKVLSTELALKGIRINVVTPGLFPSRMTKEFVENKKYITQLLKHIPDGTLGNADEIANFIIFLTSDSCRHINGANLVIDGGMLNVIEGGIER